MSTFLNIPTRTPGKLSQANTPSYDSMSTDELRAFRDTKASMTREQKIAFLKSCSAVEPDSTPSSPEPHFDDKQLERAKAQSLLVQQEAEQLERAKAQSLRAQQEADAWYNPTTRAQSLPAQQEAEQMERAKAQLLRAQQEAEQLERAKAQSSVEMSHIFELVKLRSSTMVNDEIDKLSKAANQITISAVHSAVSQAANQITISAVHSAVQQVSAQTQAQFTHMQTVMPQMMSEQQRQAELHYNTMIQK